MSTTYTDNCVMSTNTVKSVTVEETLSDNKEKKEVKSLGKRKHSERDTNESKENLRTQFIANYRRKIERRKPLLGQESELEFSDILSDIFSTENNQVDYDCVVSEKTRTKLQRMGFEVKETHSVAPHKRIVYEVRVHPEKIHEAEKMFNETSAISSFWTDHVTQHTTICMNQDD